MHFFAASHYSSPRYSKKSLFLIGSIFLCIVLQSFLSHTAAASNSEPQFGFSKLDWDKPLIVKGNELDQLLGQSFEELSLEAVKNGKFEPIPYQFDDINTFGVVHFEESRHKIDGAHGVLNENDELVFMLQDVGEQKQEGQIPSGKIVQELKVEGTNGGVGYVYIIQGSRLRSDELHVRYSAELGIIETDHFSLTLNPKNGFLWDGFEYFTYTGEESAIDSIRLGAEAKLWIPFLKVTIDNKNIIARPVAESAKSVRTTALYKVVAYLLGIPFVSFEMQAHFYAKEYRYIATLKVPTIRMAMLRRVDVSMSFDGNWEDGVKIYQEAFPDSPMIIDGKMSEYESNLGEHRIPRDSLAIATKGDYGFEVIALTSFEGIDESELSLIYEEYPDRELKPERLIGQLPDVGYKFHKIPRKGKLSINFRMMLNEDFGEYEFADIEKEPTYSARFIDSE